jgi:benzodiazapine receptor
MPALHSAALPAERKKGRMSEIASRAQLRIALLRVALITVPLVLLLGLLSATLAGSGSDNPWFARLAKPSFMPPDWAFPVVWSLLYIMMGFALALVIGARSARGRALALALFALQLLLNLAWSPLFFGAHKLGAAFALMIALLAAAIAATVTMGRIRRVAGLLMLPYLVWLCFAALLFHAVWRLNPYGEMLAPDGNGTQILL